MNCYPTPEGPLRILVSRLSSPCTNLVGLSNICYTVPEKIIQSIPRGFPTQRSHGESVVFTAVDLELFLEILKRIKGMIGIEILVILTMRTFDFTVMPWRERTYLLMTDPISGQPFLKHCEGLIQR